MTEKEFVNKWNENLKNTLKRFPDEFLGNDVVTKELKLPGKPLVPGSELFGSYEIIDTDGVPVIQVNEYSEVKYIMYAHVFAGKDAVIPTDTTNTEKAVKNFERHLDNLVKDIIKDYKLSVKDGRDEHKAVNTIFNLFNLKRY